MVSSARTPPPAPAILQTTSSSPSSMPRWWSAEGRRCRAGSPRVSAALFLNFSPQRRSAAHVEDECCSSTAVRCGAVPGRQWVSAAQVEDEYCSSTSVRGGSAAQVDVIGIELGLQVELAGIELQIGDGPAGGE